MFISSSCIVFNQWCITVEEVLSIWMLPLLQDYSNSVVSHYLHSLIPSHNVNHVFLTPTINPIMNLGKSSDSIRWKTSFQDELLFQNRVVIVLQQRLVEHNISRFSQLSVRLGKSNCFVDCLVERKVSRFSQLSYLDLQDWAGSPVKTIAFQNRDMLLWFHHLTKGLL